MFCYHSNYSLLQVKEVMIIIDGNVINNSYCWIFRQGLSYDCYNSKLLLYVAPGHGYYDYGQMISFDTNNNSVIRLDNFITFPINMSTVTMPTGCILVALCVIKQVVILNNAHQSYMSYSCSLHGEIHTILDSMDWRCMLKMALKYYSLLIVS